MKTLTEVARLHQPSRALTTREREVLQFAANGINCQDAAASMGVSREYVKKLRYMVLLKLGADTMAQAVVMALRRKLIDLD